jgi:DNA replicative helicase MCM subunit Mcm2 (Cdc46/Mcm family)
MLRKYIQYAKERVSPKLHHLDQDKLSRLYADLRRESLTTGSYPITVRHLESMIRMAEASARMHLREFVRSSDIDLAISAAIFSFISAQKMSIKKQLERVRIFVGSGGIALTYVAWGSPSANTFGATRTRRSSWLSCLAKSSRTRCASRSPRTRD